MNETARSKAEEKFAKARDRQRTFEKERAKAETVLDQKILRLRALRLAKEATDREETERKAVEKAAAPPAKRASRRQTKPDPN